MKLFTSITIAAAMSAATSAQVIYVDVDATGADDGTSWADAYNDLQDALSAASNTEIWVAEGTYTPDASNRSISYQLKSGVALYGGFGGDETALDERNLTDHETILSGDLANNDPTVSDNTFVLVRTTGVDSTAILDGFTIRDAYSRGIFGGGGAVIRYCVITDNGEVAAGLEGGGANVTGSPDFVECIFVGNTADLGGGGMRIGPGSSIDLVNCCFLGNVVDDGFGGGLLVSTGFGDSVRLANCVFHENSTTFGFGGGIHCDVAANVFIDCSTVAHNHATDGGGIVPGSGTRIRNSIVYGNTSTTGSTQSTQIDGTGVAAIIDYTCIEDFNGTYGTGNTGA